MRFSTEDLRKYFTENPTDPFGIALKITETSGYLPPNVDVSIIAEFPQMKWDIDAISGSVKYGSKYITYVPTEFIIENAELFRWNWEKISQFRPDIPLQFIKENTHNLWDWGALFKRFREEDYAEITDGVAECVFKIDPDFHDVDLFKRMILRFSNISLDFVQTRLRADSVPFTLYYRIAISNKNRVLPLEMIFKMKFVSTKFYQMEWDYLSFVENYEIKPEHVRANPDYPWDWTDLAVSPDFDPETLIELNPNYKAEDLARSPNITLDFIIEHPEYDWDWQQLSNIEALYLDSAE